MNSFDAHLYRGMLPQEEIPGHIGYYPVTSHEEREALPDLYKTLEWQPIKDHHNNNNLRAVKSVIFHDSFVKPYGISADIHIHPEDVHKVLFCNFSCPDCLLYSISAVELEGGTRLGAKWLQDSISGAFAVVVGNTYVGKQGGFRGFIPEHVNRLEDGTFKFDFKYGEGKTNYYALGNPFTNTQYNHYRPLKTIIENAEADTKSDINHSSRLMHDPKHR